MLNDKTLTFDKTLDKTLRASIFMLWLDRTVMPLNRCVKGTYRILTDARRTLRPLSCTQLEKLRISIEELRAVKFPHSKLHELQEVALAAAESQAEWRIRDIFARSRHGRDRSQRRALWEAVETSVPTRIQV